MFCGWYYYSISETLLLRKMVAKRSEITEKSWNISLLMLVLNLSCIALAGLMCNLFFMNFITVSSYLISIFLILLCQNLLLIAQRYFIKDFAFQKKSKKSLK